MASALRIREQFLLGQGFLAFEPTSADVLEAGHWQVDLVQNATNTWVESDVVEELLELSRRYRSRPLSSLTPIQVYQKVSKPSTGEKPPSPALAAASSSSTPTRPPAASGSTREWARDADDPASAFLEDHLDDELRTSLFVACGLLLGVERSDRSEQERRRVEKALAVVPVVLPSPGLAPLYGRVLANLQRRGNAIATIDLLIAGTALVEGAPLVTRNPSHFERVSDLRVLEY